MRICLGLGHTCNAVALAVVLGAATISPAGSQSLIEALSTTYNSNPDLLASRALLRQTDESLAQAVANWRKAAGLPSPCQGLPVQWAWPRSSSRMVV